MTHDGGVAANGARRPDGARVPVHASATGRRKRRLSEPGREAALAHAVGDKVEAAYRRGDLFEKRAALMADWAAYLKRPAADVLQFSGKSRQKQRKAAG